MFMESRVLDIACACLSAIANAHSSQYSNSISADDIRRLHAARALLLEKLTSPPPGIRVLANEVGLNENKLKRGFRSLFGETVHACHRNARMDLARKLMLEGRLNVCEIACAVGYSNPSHFSRAFFNRFRVNPGAYLRDIRRSGFHACAAGADLLLPFE